MLAALKIRKKKSNLMKTRKKFKIKNLKFSNCKSSVSLACHNQDAKAVRLYLMVLFHLKDQWILILWMAISLILRVLSSLFMGWNQANRINISKIRKIERINALLSVQMDSTLQLQITQSNNPISLYGFKFKQREGNANFKFFIILLDTNLECSP